MSPQQQRYGEYEEREHTLGLVSEEREEYPAAPRRRLPTGLLTLAVMAVFSGGLYFAYVQGTHHAPASGSSDTVPLIRADERPTKVKPDHPGGMDVPDRDKLVYSEKPGGPTVERLLPGPEQPGPRPTYTPPPPLPPQAAAPAQPGTIQPVEPAAKPTPPAQQQAAATPAPAKLPAKPAAEPKFLAPEARAPVSTGGVRVQLGSLRTPDAAREEWARLKGEHPDVLGKLTAVAVKADLGEKGIYYRVQAGPLADAAAAEKLCETLKRRNLGCSIVR